MMTQPEWAVQAQHSLFMEFANRLNEAPVTLAKQQVAPVFANSVQQYGTSYIESRPELKRLFSRMAAFIEDKNATVEDFCELTLCMNQIEHSNLLRDVCTFVDHLAVQQECPFSISFSELKNRAKRQRIDRSDESWLFAYLNQFPILTEFTLGFSASVRFQEGVPDCFFINDFNNKILHKFVAPLLVNSAFPDSNPVHFFAFSDEFVAHPEAGASFAPPYDSDSVSDSIVSISRFLAGQPHNLDAVPSELLNVGNKEMQRLMHELGMSVHDFIFFHEVSHILLGHEPRKAGKSEELNADILAANILTDCDLDYNEHLLKSKERDGGLGYSLRTMGPALLMYVVSIVNVLTGSESVVHPYAPLRNLYLKVTNHMKFMRPTMLCHTYRSLWEHYERLFERALEKLGVTIDVMREKHDDIELRMVSKPIRDELI